VEFGGYDEDTLEVLADLLAKVRAELIGGDTTFLEAVVSVYDDRESDEDEDEDETDTERPEPSPAAALEAMSKGELQQLCAARGIDFRKSWTKAQLRKALAAAVPAPSVDRPKGLSKAARTIVGQMRLE
jgi:hypothetical protein